MSESELEAKMHLTVIFPKCVWGEPLCPSQSPIRILNPVRNIRDQGWGQTLCEWMLISLNASNKDYNSIVLRLYLQYCVWLVHSTLSQCHFIKVILTFKHNLVPMVTSLQCSYNNIITHPMVEFLLERICIIMQIFCLQSVPNALCSVSNFLFLKGFH